MAHHLGCLQHWRSPTSELFVALLSIIILNLGFYSPSVAPYACGNKQCWPAGTPKSVSCFSTSGELSNHYKAEHGGDMITDEVKPFRCALEGCGKGWKVGFFSQIRVAERKTDAGSER
jgi:hypothetical protein